MTRPANHRIGVSTVVQMRVWMNRTREFEMIYEWRVYHIAEDKMPNILARFRDVTMGLFDRHGMSVIGFWTQAGEDANDLLYLMAFDSVEDRASKWREFAADPDWVAARAESEKDGQLVTGLESTLMEATDFSPLQ